MEVTDGLVVTIEYELEDAEGNVVESSAERGPVSFTMGAQRMLPGLEAVLRGMKVGEERKGTIPAGELVPREFTGTRVIGVTEFPEGLDPQVGARFKAKGLDGNPVLFEVVERTDETVKVQLLHYLHEVDVTYDVKVLAVRKANVPPPPPLAEDVPDLTDDLVEGSLELEPEADEPAADEPATDEPAADEPAADEPEADEPAADEPEEKKDA